MSIRIQQNTHSSGFTLVEMLVSIALFTVVLTMSVGTLLVLIDTNGRAQSMQLVMTNFTFALDSMTREIRTGFNWWCKNGSFDDQIPARDKMQDCSNGTNISIVESNSNLSDKLVCAPSCSDRVSYRHNPDAYGPGHGALERRLGTTGHGITSDEFGDWVPLTGSEIWIDEFRVVVEGTRRLNPPSGPAGDTEQPTASVYIKGRAGVDASGVADISTQEFDIQTTISQRLLDI